MEMDVGPMPAERAGGTPSRLSSTDQALRGEAVQRSKEGGSCDDDSDDSDFHDVNEAIPPEDRKYVVKATREILSAGVLFDRGLRKSDCYTLAEAAKYVRADARLVQQNKDTCDGGLKAIDEEIASLREYREKTESGIRELCQEQLAILQTKILKTIQEREEELLAALYSECEAKQSTLERQRGNVLSQCEWYTRICDDFSQGKRGIDCDDDLQLVTLLQHKKELWSEMGVASVPVSRISPAESVTVGACTLSLLPESATDFACARLAKFGREKDYSLLGKDLYEHFFRMPSELTFLVLSKLGNQAQLLTCVERATIHLATEIAMDGARTVVPEQIMAPAERISENAVIEWLRSTNLLPAAITDHELFSKHLSKTVRKFKGTKQPTLWPQYDRDMDVVKLQDLCPECYWRDKWGKGRSLDRHRETLCDEFVLKLHQKFIRKLLEGPKIGKERRRKKRRDRKISSKEIELAKLLESNLRCTPERMDGSVETEKAFLEVLQPIAAQLYDEALYRYKLEAAKAEKAAEEWRPVLLMSVKKLVERLGAKIRVAAIDAPKFTDKGTWSLMTDAVVELLCQLNETAIPLVLDHAQSQVPGMFATPAMNNAPELQNDLRECMRDMLISLNGIHLRSINSWQSLTDVIVSFLKDLGGAKIWQNQQERLIKHIQEIELGTVSQSAFRKVPLLEQYSEKRGREQVAKDVQESLVRMLEKLRSLDPLRVQSLHDFIGSCIKPLLREMATLPILKGALDTLRDHLQQQERSWTGWAWNKTVKACAYYGESVTAQALSDRDNIIKAMGKYMCHEGSGGCGTYRLLEDLERDPRDTISKLWAELCKQLRQAKVLLPEMFALLQTEVLHLADKHLPSERVHVLHLLNRWRSQLFSRRTPAKKVRCNRITNLSDVLECVATCAQISYPIFLSLPVEAGQKPVPVASLDELDDNANVMVWPVAEANMEELRPELEPVTAGRDMTLMLVTNDHFVADECDFRCVELLAEDPLGSMVSALQAVWSGLQDLQRNEADIAKEVLVQTRWKFLLEPGPRNFCSPQREAKMKNWFKEQGHHRSVDWGFDTDSFVAKIYKQLRNTRVPQDVDQLASYALDHWPCWQQLILIPEIVNDHDNDDDSDSDSDDDSDSGSDDDSDDSDSDSGDDSEDDSDSSG